MVATGGCDFLQALAASNELGLLFPIRRCFVTSWILIGKGQDLVLPCTYWGETWAQAVPTSPSTDGAGGSLETVQWKRQGERSPGSSPTPHRDKAPSSPMPMVFLGQAFTIVLVLWNCRNPYVHMNFYGLLIFQASFLPWISLGFSLLLGESIIVADFQGPPPPSSRMVPTQAMVAEYPHWLTRSSW